jgi:hypothetical protein
MHGTEFLRLNKRVSQVCSRRSTICRTRDSKLEKETSRRHIFLIFRPFQVPKEPRQGFWDAAEPLEQSVCHFEHCKACF